MKDKNNNNFYNDFRIIVKIVQRLSQVPYLLSPIVNILL